MSRKSLTTCQMRNRENRATLYEAKSLKACALIFQLSGFTCVASGIEHHKVTWTDIIACTTIEASDQIAIHVPLLPIISASLPYVDHCRFRLAVDELKALNVFVSVFHIVADWEPKFKIMLWNRQRHSGRTGSLTASANEVIARIPIRIDECCHVP